MFLYTRTSNNFLLFEITIESFDLKVFDKNNIRMHKERFFTKEQNLVKIISTSTKYKINIYLEINIICKLINHYSLKHETKLI